MRKLVFIPIVTALVFVMVLAGCAGQAPAPTPAPTPTTTAPTPAPSPEPTKPSEAWTPTEVITWIVPYGAGGGFDTRTRGIAKYMEPLLGVPIVIKNIGGAGGRTGTAAAFRETNDGYTWATISGAGTLASQMIMETGYDINEFEILGSISKPDYFTFVVDANGPFKNIDDLRDFAKAERPVKHGSSGKGAVTHLMGEITLTVMDIPHSFVGGYAAMPDTFAGLLRGDIDYVFSPLANLMQIIDSGDVRCIGVVAKERLPEVPDAPTVVELGFPELTPLGNTRYAVAPPGTPQDRVDVIAKTMQKAMSDPEFQAWATKVRIPSDYATPEETRAALAEQVGVFEKYKDVLAKAMED
jgi:tripartite-type tricarboxylate transporter receptor subunit TctC